ncbi:hypothetical protein HGM15179_019549, partial [Zosterops borbonicus]
QSLNSNTGPLTAAVRNIAELIATTQEQAHQIMATIDFKDIFLMERQQYTFIPLPVMNGDEKFKHSPTLAHHALAQELSLIPPAPGVRAYQYIDDILVAGDEIASVQPTQAIIIKHLESLDLHIPPEKSRVHRQLPSQEWKGGMVCIPPDTLPHLDPIKPPETKTDLQHALGL